MAKFVYIDETGTSSKQAYLTLVGVVVDETMVRSLGEEFRKLAMARLGWLPANFEFHGNELWNPTKSSPWVRHSPSERISTYESAIGLLDTCDLSICHATINKAALHLRHAGAADGNAYRLALQFLLEKVDALGSENKILVADEAKEHELRSVAMVADMQQWGGGEVPGRTLRTVIDSLHFVRSNASSGVQMADLVAYMIQRRRSSADTHPEAIAAVERLSQAIGNRTRTYRQSWPN